MSSIGMSVNLGPSILRARIASAATSTVIVSNWRTFATKLISFKAPSKSRTFESNWPAKYSIVSGGKW